VATIILTAMRFDPRYRSAMNIRYGEDILRACQAANLRIARCSRQDEPMKAQSHEDLSLAWGVAKAIEGMGTVPDIIYDLGEVGKEAMMQVLGYDAVEVARKVLMIRHQLSCP
jgi:predicted fused transcriptional regulator/phosphomethylpyrimidine kinase